MRSCTYVLTHTRIHTRTHVTLHADAHACLHTCIHTCAHARTRTHARARTRTGPSRYQNNAACRWHLSSPSGTRLTLTFTTVFLEHGFDFVKVHLHVRTRISPYMHACNHAHTYVDTHVYADAICMFVHMLVLMSGHVKTACKITVPRHNASICTRDQKMGEWQIAKV